MVEVVQPATGWHPSVVHGLPSLQLRAAAAVHKPPWQVSSPLHTLASVHDDPLGTAAIWQPDSGAHVSVVHGLPSLQLGAMPALQTPPTQVSAPLQRLPSVHEVPLATGVVWQPAVGLQLSAVHTLPSLQVSGVPAVQTPA
jgi:hypothetical protein